MHLFRASFFGACLLGALVCVPASPAQQQPAQPSSQPSPAPAQDQSAAPIPAYHSPLASQADNSGQQPIDDSQNVTPDNRSLAGAENLSLGSPETSRSYWEPHVDVIATADSNAFGYASGWTTYESIIAGVNVHKISGHSDLTVGYAGGASLSSDGSTGNTPVQQLNFAEKITARRIVLSFLDHMYDFPQAYFGYGSLTGDEGVGLQGGLTPVTSVLTTRGQQITNTFITEMDVNLTPRSSFTVLGGYSLLHYFDNQPNLLNSTTVTAQAGYNRKVTAKDTLAVLYRFSDFQYSALNQSINDHVVQLSYGRRVTGRLAFQVAAGPEYTLFETPILQNSAGTAFSTSQLNWSANASFTYQLRRASFRASYFHGVSAGSGVTAGSINDNVTASLSKQLTRTVTGAINGGYARNQALAIPGFGIYSQNYDYAFGGVSLSRPWGRSLNLSLSYQAQYQFSNDAFCVGVTCGTSVVAHLISAGLHWQARPMLF
jgi:hypothetical protein